MTPAADHLTAQALAVFAAGLDAHARLLGPDPPDVAGVHAELKELVLSGGRAAGHPEYAPPVPRPLPQAYAGFLGVRYALVCWLDELFIDGVPAASTVRAEWLRRPLEPDLYGGTQERAWRFWEQAELANAHVGSEPAEAYLWAAALGFRGLPGVGKDPDDVLAKARKKGLAAREAAQKDTGLPADLRQKPRVPPLAGRAAERTAARAALAAAALAVLAGVILLMRHLNS